MQRPILFLLLSLSITACATTESPWHLALRHTSTGEPVAGSAPTLVSAVRRGCALRVAWGARRARDPSRTIEHVATPVWVAIRDTTSVEVQLTDFLINLNVLGEDPAENANYAPYGGTDKAVMWRANLKTDGSFNAVWYDPVTGKLIRRVPQQHEMSWYVDCPPGRSTPLFPS